MHEPVIEQVLNGDHGVIGQEPPVYDPIPALSDDVLLGEPAGGILQFPQRVPVPPPQMRHLRRAPTPHRRRSPLRRPPALSAGSPRRRKRWRSRRRSRWPVVLGQHHAVVRLAADVDLDFGGGGGGGGGGWGLVAMVLVEDDLGDVLGDRRGGILEVKLEGLP